jgi:uncharacterized protein
MKALFLNIYYQLKAKRWLYYLIMLSSCLLILFFALKTKFNEDISNFLPDNQQNERINFVYKNIGFTDKIIVRLSFSDSSRNDQDALCDYAEMLADSIRNHFGKDEITDIFYKVDETRIEEISNFILDNLPLYLEESDYRRMDSIVDNESEIYKILEANKSILVSPVGGYAKNVISKDPLHFSSTAFEKLQAGIIENEYETYDGYIFSKDHKQLMFFITTTRPVSETSENKKVLSKLKGEFATLSKSSDNEIKTGYFGAVDIAISNAERIKKDSNISILISVSLILILFGIFFKKKISLVLLVVPVIFGGGMALACMYLIQGSVSAIALGAGSAIFGIAINYSLHFLIHLQDEDSVVRTISDLVKPLLIGSITTIVAFLSLLLISSDSMRDFGLFASLALSGTILFVLIFLPQLVNPGEKRLVGLHKQSFIDKISSYNSENNKYLILAILVLTVVFSIFSFRVGFESDMNQLNYMTREQKESFKQISKFTTLSQHMLYYVSEGKDLNSALKAYENSMHSTKILTETGKVIQVRSISNFIQSDSLQQRKIKAWNTFWEGKASKLIQYLQLGSQKLGYKKGSFDEFYANLQKNYQVKPFSYFKPLTNSILKDYLIIKPDRAMVISILYSTGKQTDSSINSLVTNPKSFVFDKGSTTRLFINSLSNDFNLVLWICSIVVFAFLWLSFGRFELTFIAFLPLIISWIWILGIMALLDMKFNIVNIILATFIFGLGDDYSIFMMDGLIHEFSFKRKLLTSYKTAVILSSLTMLIGIGTLIIAKHPAMKSLAQVTIIGMLTVVLISYTIPPFLYKQLTRKKGVKDYAVVTLPKLFRTFYSFVFFLFGSLVLNIIGAILLIIMNKTEKNKLRFHKALQWIAKFVVNALPKVRLNLINYNPSDFNKPSIIISNHQSHIDLMYILMLSPKIIILTNKWVWNSPFYGLIIRFAEFYPAANGIEENSGKLKEMIDRGYSIVIFPEGTRSEDCSIKRFHRGAFYLAEQWKLDILPVMLHGIGYVFPKKEFLLRKGVASVKILEKITPSDTRYGTTYQERTKQIRKLYRAEFETLAGEVENAHYYADKILHNYIYKGPSIERKARQLLNVYDDFETLIGLMPDSGNILEYSCETGVMSLMLAQVKKGLLITATDTQEENLLLAENCVSVTPAMKHISHNEYLSSPLHFDVSVWIQKSPRSMLTEEEISTMFAKSDSMILGIHTSFIDSEKYEDFNRKIQKIASANGLLLNYSRRKLFLLLILSHE